MRILVLSRNAWDDTNSIGNTLSNFFADMEDVEFANIYFRSSKPNNGLCKKYYRVTEKDILKNYFSPKKIGQSVEYSKSINEKAIGYSREKKLISFIHRFNLRFFYWISDALFNSEKWINKKLDSFITDFNPDIVFSFAKSSSQYYLTIKHIKKLFDSKIVLWIADDEYTSLSLKNNKASKRDLKRLEYVINAGTKVYGCSQQICDYYNDIFNCHSTPHYKNCHFDYPVRTSVNNPIKIVYAGNLLFGREKTLCEIVAQLTKLNALGQKFCLEIYSNTFLSKEQKQLLTKSGVSAFLGQRSYEEIKSILSNSDILLIIESFEPGEILKTKYSFSTKIIDCLQSGSSILAIGPNGIATIDYVKSIPGAEVINDIKYFENLMSEIADNPLLLVENANRIRQFALQNHSPVGNWPDV